MTHWGEKWPRGIWFQNDVQKTQIKIAELIFKSVLCAQSLHHGKIRAVEIIGTHDAHAVCAKLWPQPFKWCINKWLHKWKDQFYVEVSYVDLPLDGVLAPQTIQRQPWAICCYCISYPLCHQCCSSTAHSQYIYMNVKTVSASPLDKSCVIIISDNIQRWQEISCTAHIQKCLSLVALPFSFFFQNQRSIDWKNAITRARWVNYICCIGTLCLSWQQKAISEWINRYTTDAVV